VPLIHVSTDYVFDGTAADFYREDDPVGPISTYGASKLEGERLVVACAPLHVIIRTAWVHSPWGHNFVKTMLRLAETRDDVRVVDDQLGSPTYAPHLADALIAVAEHVSGKYERGPWGIFHAVNAGETTWCGLAREIFRQAARHRLPVASVNPLTTASYPTLARRPANSRLACGKLQGTFGLALPDWRQGVTDCLARLAAERAALQSATVSNTSESRWPKT
jgi:dTDP-4-dehydrorhamnose reductase